MSGLLALLDDVAALAKLAAAQVDDVAVYAGKAGAKAAGVVIDDSAVTPKYVHGLPAARELPIVWKIARASLFNKLVILLPVALLLNAYAPWLLVPLLMIGGIYLCFEGAEKVYHLFVPEKKSSAQRADSLDAAHLERQRVAGAIKTDFILSAEIMTIALSAIDSGDLWVVGLSLAIVAVAITAIVYGTVALLVKADDIGLRMAQDGRLSVTRWLGRRIVKVMPSFMEVLATIGTLAMLWVGGSIITHGLADLGYGEIEATIKSLALQAAELLPTFSATAEWMTKALLDAAAGLVVGLVFLPLLLAILPSGASEEAH